MWLYLVIVIFSLCVWIHIKWQRVRRYWGVRNVPHLPPHPVLGSLTFLDKENPALWMTRMFKAFQTPYVGIWLFWKPALIINSPELAKNILVRDAENFRNRYASSGKTDPIGALNLFALNDPLWSVVRRRLSPIFTSAKLKMFQQIPQVKSTDLLERLKTNLEQNIEINLRDIFADYSTDVIGETVFGMRSESTLSRRSALREITKEFMKYDFMRKWAWTCIFFYPKMVDIFGFSMFPKNTVISLSNVFRTVAQQRGGYDSNVTNIKDLFDALVKIKQEAALEGEDIHEDLLIAQAVIFLQGGFDTTSVTLTYAVYELAYQPSIQDKLYEELIEAKERSGSDKIDAHTLNGLPYLNAVLKETMRKYPILGWLDRVAAKDYQLDENLTIPAGSVVYVNVMGLQSSPENFPEPEKFDPERFMPDNEKLMNPYTYMPFGVGPRHCIGERFAMQSMRFALSSLILNLEIRPLPGYPVPNEAGIEKRGVLLTPARNMSVQFIPKN